MVVKGNSDKFLTLITSMMSYQLLMMILFSVVLTVLNIGLAIHILYLSHFSKLFLSNSTQIRFLSNSSQIRYLNYNSKSTNHCIMYVTQTMLEKKI